jgi:hypothetical protein
LAKIELTIPGQLRKMGILTSDKAKASPVASRRKSTGLHFGELKPLNAAAGTKNFAGYRDAAAKSPKEKDADAMDSDADDEDETKIKVEEGEDDKDEAANGLLSPEDALRQRELAEGVQRIKVCIH